ncbi:UDP-glucose 4-epimerase GalE [Oxalobacter sp. OttesenSCG-928-P03]|nr:UDP-glucose 4-epimerase GalE [Oxalobacter sp. OttesenSCG-928-P03]
MNILLTGGTGYIGSHTAIELTNAGHHVLLFDNLSNSAEKVVERLSQIAGKNLTFVYGDVREAEKIRKILQQYQIDAVIHFAGLKAVADSVKAPVEYYANNVQGTINLLEAMQLADIKTLVFSSSATVYGEPDYLPIDESHPTSAVNPYGRSKLHIEEMLKDVASSDSEWRIACLRYFNPVGAHQSGLIGESPNDTPNNLMPFLARVATGAYPELKVFGNDYPTSDGTGVRDYIHVMDLAEGHVAALEYLKEHRGWHAINLGTGRGYSVLELVHAFEAASGQNIPVKFISRRQGDVAICYADSSKAAAELNWRARRDLADMCMSAWLFQKKTDSES